VASILRRSVNAWETLIAYDFYPGGPHLKVKVTGARRIRSPNNPLHPLHGKKFPASAARPVGTNDVSQNVAKTYLPPKTSIWRGETRGLWACHVQGHKRFSEQWSHHEGDSWEALMAVIRKAWRMFSRDEQLPVSACPIAGLFEP